jgi:hypothetical protein
MTKNRSFGIRIVLAAMMALSVAVTGCSDDPPQQVIGGSGGDGGSGGTGGTAGSGGTGGNGGGNGGGDPRAGLYRMQASSPGSNDYWEVCFFVAPDLTKLTASDTCDVDQNDDDPYSFDFTTQVGTSSSGPCSMNFNWDQDVTISNRSFSINFTVPGEGITYDVNGAFIGGAGPDASGAVQKRNDPDVGICSFNWTATHQP